MPKGDRYAGKRGLLLILILSLLAGCQSKTQMSAEQRYLQTLQKSQAELTALFENGQPQSPDWLAQLVQSASNGVNQRRLTTAATRKSQA
ncbi:MAG: hypothetical protein ACLSA6_04055 [Holdemania massiliensis]